MKDFVRIQSNITINVTSGLENVDVSNPDAHIPDRLRVNPLWTSTTVKIRQGAGVYPSEIKNWNTVQALARDGVLTIGEEVDDGDEAAKAELARNLEANAAENTETYSKSAKATRKKKAQTLEEVAE